MLQSEEHVVSLNGSCVVDVATNSLQVTEGGRVVAKVSEDPFIEKEARLMYDGMTGVLSASRPLEGVQVHELGPGVCGYTFTLPLDTAGVTLAWTMADDKQQGGGGAQCEAISSSLDNSLSSHRRCSRGSC